METNKHVHKTIQAMISALERKKIIEQKSVHLVWLRVSGAEDGKKVEWNSVRALKAVERFWT